MSTNLLFESLTNGRPPIHSSHKERSERPREWYCVSPCITGAFYSAFTVTVSAQTSSRTKAMLTT
jgi:hypothetical protein